MRNLFCLLVFLVLLSGCSTTVQPPRFAPGDLVVYNGSESVKDASQQLGIVVQSDSFWLDPHWRYQVAYATGIQLISEPRLVYRGHLEWSELKQFTDQPEMPLQTPR